MRQIFQGQTKAELIDRERQFHEVQPEGIILKFGTVVGFVVGVIILYQVLYSDVKICIPKILPCPLYRFLLDSRLPTPDSRLPPKAARFADLFHLIQTVDWLRFGLDGRSH